LNVLPDPLAADFQSKVLNAIDAISRAHAKPHASQQEVGELCPPKTDIVAGHSAQWVCRLTGVTRFRDEWWAVAWSI